MKPAFTAIAAASLALIGQAQAAHARVAYICPQLAGSELQVTVKSGCISTSSTLAKNDLALDVDQNNAVIRVSGDLKFESRSLIGTADCMGARNETLSAAGMEARRYSVMFNGVMLGIADFLDDSANAVCLNAGGQRTAEQDGQLSLSRFSDWDDDPVAGWQNWRDSSVIDVLGPILAGYPEGLEGQPTAEIVIKKQRWMRRVMQKEGINWRDPFIGVSITQHGYLDDAVSGGRYFAALRQEDNGEWKLAHFWKQNMCARGPNAGQWTADLCP
ncbi:hypothetical protein [Erythrobacter sp. MTPC3]|uniref:hypothetical protein n=1 Tax=Erythrobacter sp. MTPC3 TaxID=3056564 RepID=UPI0036F42686